MSQSLRDRAVEGQALADAYNLLRDLFRFHEAYVSGGRTDVDVEEHKRLAGRIFRVLRS